MNRLLKQAEEEFVYKFKSPITVNIGDEYTWRADVFNLTEDKEYENVIKDAVNSDMSEMGSQGLAEYLDPEYNKIIYPYIKSIIVTVENSQAITIVKANKELTSEEKDAVKNYISGQFSDGWGESMEQETLDEWEETVEEDVEDEDGEYYKEEVPYKATMSASFWNNKNWSLTEV